MAWGIIMTGMMLVGMLALLILKANQAASPPVRPEPAAVAISPLIKAAYAFPAVLNQEESTGTGDSVIVFTGIVRMVVMIWTLAFSMVTESNAEERRLKALSF